MSALFDTKKFRLPRGEGGEEEEEKKAARRKFPRPPISFSPRPDFGGRVEWAMNWFFEKENTGDRGREWGFSQAADDPGSFA